MVMPQAADSWSGESQCSMTLRAAFASASSLVSTAASSRRPPAKSSSRRAASWSAVMLEVASGGQPSWLASPRECEKAGVCMISRYCSFWAAARVATSSSHSATAAFFRASQREKVEKNWSWPLQPLDGT